MARALERILGVCARDGTDSSVTVQYVQVYLDAAYDLLAGRGDAAKPLDVRWVFGHSSLPYFRIFFVPPPFVHTHLAVVSLLNYPITQIPPN